MHWGHLVKAKLALRTLGESQTWAENTWWKLNLHWGHLVKAKFVLRTLGENWTCDYQTSCSYLVPTLIPHHPHLIQFLITGVLCDFSSFRFSFLFFITVVWSLITQVSYSSSLWSDASSVRFPFLFFITVVWCLISWVSYSSSLWCSDSSLLITQVSFPHHCSVLIHHSGFWWIISQVSFLHHCGLMPHLSGFLSSSLSSDLSSLGFSFLFFITVVWSLRFPFLFIIGFPIPHHLGGGCLGIQKGSSLLHHSGVLSDSSSPRWPYAADKTF